jgi:hypothetical protein
VAAHSNLRTYGTPIIYSPAGEGKKDNAFFSAVLFTCKAFNVHRALEFMQHHFGASQLGHREF